MKKIFFLFLLHFLTFGATAQQEQQYTQFMYNKLAYNPAYAGSNMAACFTALHRSQWIGLDGAPKAQLVSFNTPMLNGRVGVGGNIAHQSIGIDSRITADAAYAYRFPVAHGFLGVGIQASIRYRSINFSDQRLISTVPLSQDDAIEQGLQSKIVPNFGAGVYYNTEKFFLGISIPRLVRNRIGFLEVNGITAREESHIYAMGGFIIPISSNLKMQPQALIKFAPRSPFDFEGNLSFMYLDKYSLGASYRVGNYANKNLGESVDFLVGLQATEKLMFGFAYDYSLSPIRNKNSGSIEVMLRYCMRKAEGENFVNPRFF